MRSRIIWSIFFLSLYIFSPQSFGFEGFKIEKNDLSSWLTVPAGSWWVPVLSFEISAEDEDVEIYSIIVKRTGLSTDETLTGISAFSNGIKITDSEDDNNGNADEAELEIAGEFIIPAHNSRTITIVANIASVEDVPSIGNHEFSLRLLAIETAGWNKEIPKTFGEIFRIWAVDIGLLKFKGDEPLDRISLSKNNRIFEFDLEAPENTDITVEGIRLRSTYNDLDNDFEDIILALDNKIIAKWVRHDEYVTFIFKKWLFLSEGNRETFTIAARVKSKVDEELEFFLDGAEDLIYTDEIQGTTSGFYRETKKLNTPSKETEKIIPKQESLEEKITDATQRYISRIEQENWDTTQRIVIFQNTIDILERLSISRPEFAGVIPRIILVLEDQIARY